MLNNIYELISGNLNELYIDLFIVIMCWGFMIISVLIDLWTGVERARSCGEKIKSNKLRLTVNKISDYWRIMIFGLFIDVALFIVLDYHVPFGSLLFMIACCSIECKSVIENLRRKKSAAAEVPKAVIDLMKSLDNPNKIKEYIDILNTLNHKHKEE